MICNLLRDVLRYAWMMRPWWIVVAVACGGGAAAKLDATVADTPPADAAPDAGLLVTTGSLDPSFGSGGMITMDFGGADYAAGAALLPSGRLLVGVSTTPAGSDVSTSQLVAFTTDGAIDTGFGSGGSVALDVPGGLFGVLADGSLIIGGGYGAFEHRFADGSLDPAYGSGGHAAASFVVGGQPVAIFVTGVTPAALDSNGRIYVGAQQSDGHILVTRLTATGQRDVSFAGGGIQAGFGMPESFAVLSDGSLLIAAQGTHAVVLVHVLANGTVDPAYGGYLDGVDLARSIAVDASGRALVGGTFSTFTRSYLARFGATGALDPAFAGGYVEVPGMAQLVRVVPRAAGGALLSLGIGSPATAGILAVSDSGTAATEYASNAYMWLEMFELPAGKLLAVGNTGITTTAADDLAIARFLP